MIVDFRKIFVWLGNMNDQGRWGKNGNKALPKGEPETGTATTWIC